MPLRTTKAEVSQNDFWGNAGLDGEIDLVKALAFEGKILKTQIKAGRSYISSEKQDHVRVKVERKYVEHWNNLNMPVILLFYHPDNQKIYWKSVQDYLKCDPGVLTRKTQNVIIPFDKGSVKYLTLPSIQVFSPASRPKRGSPGTFFNYEKSSCIVYHISPVPPMTSSKIRSKPKKEMSDSTLALNNGVWTLVRGG